MDCCNSGPQGSPPYQDGRCITWFAHDVEDGNARSVRIQYDDLLTEPTPDGVEFWFKADSTFARLRPGSISHSVRVWAVDRAGFVSDSSLVVNFDLVPCVPPGSTITRRK